MKLPKKIHIRERRLGKERALGLAHHPDMIEIDPVKQGSSRERLDTVIHEGIHLLLPDAGEMMVRAYANRLSDLLWRDNWRRIEF
jgi:hypothetical protein